MKTCTGECGRTLPLNAFGPDRRREDGRQARCQKCQAAEVHRRRGAKPAALARAAELETIAQLAAQGLKRCADQKCRQVLPFESFYRSGATTDGRYAYCKQCCKAIDAARRPNVPTPLPVNTYAAVHSRLPSLTGQLCRCGEAAEEWSYDHTDPDELTSERGLPYSLDREHYRPMCRRCHRKYDADYRTETNTARPRGKPRTGKPCAACNAPFWNANHHRKTCSAACETALRSRSNSAHQERVLSTTGLSRNEVIRQATLTAEAVRDIRTRHGDRSASASELARSYGVSESSIFRVVNRESWRHVA